MFKKKAYKIFILISSLAAMLAILLLFIYAAQHAQAEFPTSQSKPFLLTKTTITQSDINGIRFQLITPPAVSKANGEIVVAGLAQRIQDPGAPALPYFATFIALPPEAEAVVTVETAGKTTRPLDTLTAVPQPKLSETNITDSSGDFQFTRFPPVEDRPDPAIFQTNSFYPAEIFTVSDPMYYRDIRLIELRLFPVRVNPRSGLLEQSQDLAVSIHFEGAQWDNQRPSRESSDTFRQLPHAFLNAEQARNWRSLPAAVTNAPETGLPTGQDVYKIELNQDGIYELTRADLAAAGMDTANVNPKTIQMMYRNQPVAYQLVNDNDDAVFDVNEKIRFYGWKFEGPRLEKQFITHNVLWLWSGGTPTIISSTTNIAGTGLLSTTSFLEDLKTEIDRSYFATWTDLWPSFENEPDAWYWDYIPKFDANPVTNTYSFEVIDPIPAASDAAYIVEVFSRDTALPDSHDVSIIVNSDPSPASKSWAGRRSENIHGTISATQLISGPNNFDFVLHTTRADKVYLNHITMTYWRQLKAHSDQLKFKDVNGDSEFVINNFTDGDWRRYSIWDVTNPLTPTQILLNNGDISGAGSYTLTVATNHPPGSYFIVATDTAVQAASQTMTVTQYTPPSLNPGGSGAEWVAISYKDFIPAANTLASHRADPAFGGYSTLVVDIEDIINQYGYGLPLPSAIHDYLAFALGNWSTPPGYITLFGDGTHNPRNLNCETGCTYWSITATNYLLTDIVFEDRFQGAIPSDYTFTLISGADLLPDVAIGRIAAESLAEADTVVGKIIQFETNQATPSAWQENILFVSDDPDGGGDFCTENMSAATHLPNNFNNIFLCLPDVYPAIPTITDTDNLRSDMAGYINDANGGVSILNYRGHGSISQWANPGILSVNMPDFWSNINKPVVLLSADCLDGYFAWPGNEGLGELFLKLDNLGADVGTAAHWSSTGLGYSWEHTALHTGFYDAVFDNGLTAIGDAINFAKTRYFIDGYDTSEMYAFTLQGDPAMQLFRPDLSLNMTNKTGQAQVKSGDVVTFGLTIENNGIYPAKAVVTNTLPSGLTYQGMTATITVTTAVTGSSIRFDVAELAWGASETITLTAVVNSGASHVQVNQALISSPAPDINPGNESDSVTIYVAHEIYLPAIVKP